MFRKLYRFAASLWLLLILLSTMGLILIAATLFSGYDITIGSLRRDWYGSWWFLPLMALLMVNLIACTLIRNPWRFWQWGFLITHTGVLTLMIGASITFQFKLYGDMRLEQGKGASQFEIEGERDIIVRTADGSVQRLPFDVNPYVRSRPGTGRAVGQNLLLYIDEYLPNVGREPVYESAPDGVLDVIELHIEAMGEKQSVYAPAGRLTEAFGGFVTVINVGEDADFFRCLSGVAGPKGTLVVTIDGKTEAIDVAANLDKPVRVGSRDVIPRKFIGVFSLDAKGLIVESPHGGQDQNPAVLFDTVTDGKTESWYALFLRPDRSPLLKEASFHDRKPPPFQAEMHYTPHDSAIWLFATPQGVRQVVTSRKGEKQLGDLAFGVRTPHPYMPQGGFYTLVRRIERAVPTVREEPPKKNVPMNPAVRVRLSRAPMQQSQWVPLYARVTLDLDGEPVTVSFEPRTFPDLGFHVTLKEFRNPSYEGSSRAMKFESDLEITDGVTRNVVHGTTGVNYPFAYNGWVFYQASFVPDSNPPISILQVSHDPGKRILYLGFVMTASGTLFMFYLRGLLVKLVKPGQTATDAPMTGATQYLWLTIGCVGTIGGTLMKFAMPGFSALWIGLGMAVVAIFVGFGLAFVAKAGIATRPGWSLQLGQITSATWCINSAALVIFMFLQVKG